MVAVVFLPLAFVERLNAHISVEIVSQHLRGRALAWMLAAASLLAALYFAALAWRTGIEAVEKFEVREITQGQIALPVWPTRFFLPFGCGLLALLLLWKTGRLAAGDLSVTEKPAGHLPEEAG
jgi:TRAP-type C4-dicarboxylate transport system permease small subunit